MTNKGTFIVFRVIGILFLIGLVAGGGFMAFQAGQAQGISQAPAVATAIAQSAETGQGAPIPPMMFNHNYGQGYGYGPGYHMYGMSGRHHFGFFPFGICGSIIFLFLFLGLIKMIFFRGMWHRGNMHGPWSKHWENGTPPMFNEWHKRSHGETPAEEDNKKE